jgi:hypothetical protein
LACATEAVVWCDKGSDHIIAEERTWQIVLGACM